ncbi:biotin--[acetyl-CoA-carboxylase] ligase [Rhodococcus antarcticus]|uniref:biotin--[biotin carboxyl-carrier protein] ligase n=1 Tax=Rhodococcus antarcticus TaxID=2987751 RepID=A0ABY6P1H6_9NOCA|nr:biotin--[acetyl-CoA-carboxylase] ligase [Rhodococcus antarcticus]UZJ25507.1 biotin--[acetyl-CoA-carboxylase] ligase [Rhodococcus antarcticus]
MADDTAWTDLDRPPLNALALGRALVAPGGWAALDVVADTGSTNADLLEAARTGAPDRTVLVAEHQGTGRGRHARTWSSPPRAGLALSVLLRTTGVPVSQLGWLPLLAGVAVVDVLRRVAEVDAVLKWPNDVLIGGRKVAGILAEVAVTSPEPAVVVGVGLNVSLRTDELPVPEATSLTLAGAALTDRDPLLRALLRELGDREREWRAGGGDPAAGLAQDYRARCSTLGQDVRVVLPHGGELLGRAVRIDDDGRLVVRDGSGIEHVLSAGDVTHVRLAGR